MRLQLGIKAGIALPLIATLVAGMSLLAIYNYTTQVSILSAEAEESVKSILGAAQTTVESHLNLYQQMAALVAANPTVAESLARSDRQRLIADMSAGYEALKKRINISQFNFHKPPGVALLRLQDLDRYGDDLAAIRRTIRDVNERKTGVKGVEIGRTGLGLRGVEPVFWKGAFVGSLEFGGDLTLALNDVKRAFGVDLGLILSREAMATVYKEWQKDAVGVADHVIAFSTDHAVSAGTLTDGALGQVRNAGGKVYIEQADYKNRSYYIGLSELKDYSGTVIGYLFVIRDKTGLVAQTLKALAVNLAIYAVIVLLVAAAIGYGMTRNVISPLMALTRAADDISLGKLADKVEIKNAKGEIAALAKSVDRMRVSMKKLLE